MPNGQPGNDIAMSGSARLAEWLLRQGLLDELRLLVYPIVVGTGRRLFTDDKPRQAMELVNSKTYLRHRRRRPHLPPHRNRLTVPT